MTYLKKSLFGILFLILFFLFHFQLTPLLVSYDWIFGLDANSAGVILSLALTLLLSAISFVIFASLSQDYRLGLLFAFLGASVPVLFNQAAAGVFLAIGFFILLTIFYFTTLSKMKKYISYEPTTLFGGTIKTLTTVLTILVCFGYYLSINFVIAQKGFEIPESIIPDALIELMINQQTGGVDASVKGDKYLAQITPEMIEYAKQHPELLKQYNITPEQLDQLETTPTPPVKAQPGSTVRVPTTNSPSPIMSIPTVKKMALAPINAIIKQYQFMVAPVLAVFLFSGLSLALFLLNLLTGLVIRSIFYILEKTNFIHFEKEMREVKKLIV